MQAAAVTLVLAMAATADGEARWRVRTTAPFAVRGGVLAVELDPLDPPSTWPPSILLRGDGGLEIRAELAVVIPAAAPIAPSWTTPADAIEVLTVDAFTARLDAAAPNATTAVNGVIVAMAPMPAGFAGAVAIAGARVEPRWIDGPQAIDLAAAPAGSPARGDDQPDPDAPGEYWRRVLLASARGEPAPAPPFTGPTRLLALQRAQLWKAGLARIEPFGASVTAALVELLTARVDDPLRPEGARSIAAWICQRGELDALLAILLDPQRDAESCMRAALGWMESRTPLTFWLESDAGARVTLAVANPLPEEMVVRCAWVEAPGEAPIAVLVPPRSLVRQSIDRPAEAAPRRDPLARDDAVPPQRWRNGATLRLGCRGWTGRLVAGPGLFAVRPPGLAFASFVPCLTLASAQAHRLELPFTPWRTTASVRRLGARWEIFIECLRPAPLPGDRVEVRLGRAEAAPVRFTVDELGAIAMVEGESNAELVAHAKSHADRWRVRLELPSAWIPPFVLGEWERVLQVSLAREPGGGHGRQTAGLAVPSWRPPAPIEADLASWVDMPAIADR